MYIWIDNKSGAPIYDQIYTQIKNQIISGQLGSDEMLPSIRNLAKDLRISVITTKRAYEELEKEGFIYTVAAKGCFVAPKNTELLREEHHARHEFLYDLIIKGRAFVAYIYLLLFVRHTRKRYSSCSVPSGGGNRSR